MYFKNKMALKASKHARFRWWWGAEAGKQVTAIENEHALLVTSPYKGIVLLPQAFRKNFPIKTVVCPFVASSSKVWDDDQKCMNMFPNLYVAVLPPFF